MTDARARALELAEAALAAAAGGPAQVAVQLERSLTSRFAGSTPTQATAIDAAEIEVAAFRDGHVGTARTGSADPEALAACAARAVAASEAAASEGPGNHPGPAAPAPVRDPDSHDPSTAALEPGRAGRDLSAVFETAGGHGLQASGLWTCGASATAVATTEGQAVAEQTTDAHLKVICADPAGRTGYAQSTAPAVGEIDAGALTDRAAGICRLRAELPEADLEPSTVPAVLEPEALAPLLELLASCAVDGLAHAEGRGAFCGRLGTRVAAARINLSDSPRFGSTLGRGFDLEGVPKGPLPLIQDGVAHRVCHDRRSGELAGQQSTGHALAPGGSTYGAGPENLVLAGGGAADSGELVGSLERGVHVTRLWYGNVVRQSEAVVTATTRDGTFLVEDGRAVATLRDLRISGSMLDLLSSVTELGRRGRLVSEGELYGTRRATGVVCPAAAVGELRVVG